MTYTCPMHPEVIQDHPGHCPHCGMNLVEQGQEMSHSHETHQEESYRPLFVILGLIGLTTLALAARDVMDASFSLEGSMRVFMSGFFLVFAGFKLLDLKGFAEGYFTYDLLAKRWFGYGYIYPFLELALGLAYATAFAPVLTDVAALVLLVFSGLGVSQKLLKHERFQCACLGTFLKVPLTKVTLIEDFGMAAMAGLMLLMRFV
jgi:hypothetical protein